MSVSESACTDHQAPSTHTVFSLCDRVAALFVLQLAFDSEGIAITAVMGFVKNPVSGAGGSCTHL